MTVIIYEKYAAANYRKRKTRSVIIRHPQTGEGWFWEYPDFVSKYEAKTMLITLAHDNPLVDIIHNRGYAPFETHPYINVDPLTRKAVLTERGRDMMGEIVRKHDNRARWASMRSGDVIKTTGVFLPQRVNSHRGIVYTVTPFGEGYAWKHPDCFTKTQAKALLLVAVYQPEYLNGFFWGPHRIREQGVSRIMSMVMMGFAVLGSDGHIRLSKTGEGFFRWSSRST